MTAESSRSLVVVAGHHHRTKEALLCTVTCGGGEWWFWRAVKGRLLLCSALLGWNPGIGLDSLLRFCCFRGRLVPCEHSLLRVSGGGRAHSDADGWSSFVAPPGFPPVFDNRSSLGSLVYLCKRVFGSKVSCFIFIFEESQSNPMRFLRSAKTREIWLGVG